MLVVFFVYGLAFFCLGLVVMLVARRPSALALSRHLPWLAFFGLTHALVEWIDMFLLAGVPAGWEAIPDDVTELAVTAVVRAWHARQAGQSDIVGTDEYGKPVVSRYLSWRDRDTLLAYTRESPVAA